MRRRSSAGIAAAVVCVLATAGCDGGSSEQVFQARCVQSEQNIGFGQFAQSICECELRQLKATIPEPELSRVITASNNGQFSYSDPEWDTVVGIGTSCSLNPVG